jgi:hypothetical protein
MNGKQRARWLSDIITELQRYQSKNKGKPESPLVQQSLGRLDEARAAAQDESPPGD